MCAFDDVRLDAHSGPVFAARFNEDGSYIASGGTDRTVKLWNLESLDTSNIKEQEDDEEQSLDSEGGVYEELVCKSALTSLEWSRLEDSHLFISSADHSAIIYDLNKSAKIKTFSHPDSVNQLSVSKRDIILSACDDGVVRLWDTRSKLAVGNVKTPLNLPVLTCCLDGNAERLYFSGINPVICCFDVRKLSEVWSENNVHSNNVTSLALSPDEDYLLSRSVDNTVKYCDSRKLANDDSKFRNRAKPYVFDGTSASEEDEWLIRARFIPDPKNEDISDLLSVVSGSNDGFTYVWEFASRRIINRLDGHKSTVLDIDYSEINNQLLTTSTDGSIVIRNL